MKKKYRVNVVPIALVLGVSFSLILLISYLQSDLFDFFRAAVVLTFTFIFVVIGSYLSWIEIENDVLTQYEWYFIRRITAINDVCMVVHDKKHRWFFGWIEYILLYEKKIRKPVVKINPNSFKSNELLELIKDIQNKNQSIVFPKTIANITK